MSQNTYKKVSRPKAEPIITQFKIWDSMKDPRLKLVIGFGLLFFSVYMFTSFFSFFWTHQADQSVIDGFRQSGIREAGRQVDNWLGIFGAGLAWFFLYKLNGISSFVLVPIIFTIGYRMVFKKPLFRIASLLKIYFFLTFWLSPLLGYIVYLSGIENQFGWLAGGFGYEIATYFDELIGIGLWLLLALAGLAGGIYLFNIRKFGSFDELAKNITAAPTDRAGAGTLGSDIIIQTNMSGSKLPKTQAQTTDSQNPNATLGLDFEKLSNPDEIDPDFPFTVRRVETIIPSENFKNPTDENESYPLVSPSLIVEIPVAEPASATLNSAVVQMHTYDPTLDLSSYQYPTTDLLQAHGTGISQVSQHELDANKERIVQTLLNYNIRVASIKATIGPTVTLYELVPEAGVRISSIIRLENDIALSLAALGIRIIAPIPGRGTVGIEVPNATREVVSLKSIISTDRFLKSDMELPIVLGKTISNDVFIADLTKMPHLLMAGATGQGKSVGINCLLTSLLYKKHPSQLKLVMIDPKKVELSLYNALEKHFLACPPDSEEAIITDVKKAVQVLNSLCIEMDSRYDLLKNGGCRNLREYNAKFISRNLNPEKGHKFLPYIVIVIDELADLMMTAGKEVELPIARIAQLARAVGMHLIVATQRPSANVITGIIKANFPARVAFKVSSKLDSRIVLDVSGAEQLVGQGDLLYSYNSEVVRLQCPFVDTPEVTALCDHISKQRGYSQAYMLPEFVGDENTGNRGDELNNYERDPAFEDAARLIVGLQQGSTSVIQRKLQLGYNRAGRIMDQMEAARIVGPAQGSKARQVLMPDLESLEHFLRSFK